MKTDRRQRSPFAIALLLSLFFHVTAGVVLFFTRPPPAPPSKNKPIEVALQYIENTPRPPPPPVAVKPPPPPPTPSKNNTRPVAPAAPIASAPPPSAPPITNTLPENSSSGVAIDVPRKDGIQALGPRLSTLVPRLPPGEDDEPHGHLLTNGPGEQPDPEVLSEYNGEKAKRKIDNALAGMVSDAARSAGALPPYFSGLQGALNDGFARSNVEVSDKNKKEIAKDVLGTWQSTAENYGKNGSPFSNPDDEKVVTGGGLGQIVERGGIDGRDATANAQNEAALQFLGGMQAIMNSASRPRLKLVIELTQTSSGALANTVVLEKSGDPKFDEFVLHQTRKLITAHGDTEDGASPFHDESSNDFRSVWQFTWEPPKVKVKLIRVLRTPAKVE